MGACFLVAASLAMLLERHCCVSTMALSIPLSSLGTPKI